MTGVCPEAPVVYLRTMRCVGSTTSYDTDWENVPRAQTGTGNGLSSETTPDDVGVDGNKGIIQIIIPKFERSV